MKPHFDQTLPSSRQACRWSNIALSQPSGCLGASNGKQALKEKPGLRFAPLYPQEDSASLLNSPQLLQLLLGESAEQEYMENPMHSFVFSYIWDTSEQVR